MIKSTVLIMVVFLNGQTGVGKFEFVPPATCEKVWHYVMSQPTVLTAKVMECNDTAEEEAGPQQESRVAIAPLTNG